LRDDYVTTEGSHKAESDVSYMSNSVVGEMKCHRQNIRLDVVRVVYIDQQTQLTANQANTSTDTAYCPD